MEVEAFITTSDFGLRGNWYTSRHHRRKMNKYFLIGFVIYSSSFCKWKSISLCGKTVPQVQRQPPRSFLIKKEGDSLELRCIISRCQTSQLHWLHNDKSVNAANHRRIISSNNNSLKINKLTNQDRGQYTCVAVNTAGSSKKDFWIVVTPKQPERAKVLEPPKDSLAEEGDTVRLSCIITYYPQTPYPQAWAWFKDGKRADENQRRKWFERRLDGNRKEIFVTISDIQRGDEGVYACYVLFGNFRGNNDTATARLTVQK